MNLKNIFSIEQKRVTTNTAHADNANPTGLSMYADGTCLATKLTILGLQIGPVYTHQQSNKPKLV